MLRRLLISLLFWVSAWSLIAPAPVRAAEVTAWSGDANAASSWSGDANAAVRLAASASGLGAAGAMTVGVEFRFAPGWHGYWRNPGEGGAAPELDWSPSENVAAADLSWPVPTRFTLLGLDTAGYADGVILPVAVRAADPTLPVRLRLKLNWLSCSTLCVPYESDLQLALPAGPAAPTAQAERLADALARVPQSLTGPSPSAVLAGSAEAPLLRLSFAAPIAAQDLFIVDPPDLFAGRPQRVGQTLTAPLKGATVATAAGKDLSLVLAFADGSGGVALTVRPTPAPPSSGWGAALAAALLGGLILNIMPCVLPVLSLKLLAVTSLAHAGRRAARQGFLFSAAGIVVSFMMLAAAAVGLKAAGVAVGWGMQFQQPVFLAGLAALTAFFTANLWGWVEIAAPDAANQLGALRLKDPRADAFFGGVAATALATPCSAPFVGTAVGFALAGGAAEIFSVFIAMGLGLAAPHLLIAAVPDLAARLPRPGRWMLRLRTALGFGMAAACAWLFWSLAGVGGSSAALASAVVAVIAAGILAWRRDRVGATRRALGGLALVGFAVAVVVPAAFPPPAPRIQTVEGPWRPFSEAAIAQFLSEGKLVFVDVTADWCLTCKANKAAVLDQGWAAERLRAADVVALRADWTRPDPAIAAFLARHGRYGVPFNIVYGSGRPEGVALSELLTEAALRDAINQAAGGSASR